MADPGPVWGRLEDAEVVFRGGGRIPLERARFLAPVTPSKIVAAHLTYRSRVDEYAARTPPYPSYFLKPPSTLNGHLRAVPRPAGTRFLNYEGELAVVIGRGGRNIGQADAWDAVAGLTLMNDVTMRDFQRRTKQWFAGKTWERSTPIGPSVVTRDEVGDPNGLELTVTVNGELRQVAPIADLVFGIPSLVADLSRIVTLEPGDLIATGTPGGVGAAMTPERFLADGDVVEVAVSELGTLRNRFRRETPLQVA